MKRNAVSGLYAGYLANQAIRLSRNGLALFSAALIILAGLTSGSTATADIGATHTALVSESASFNTPGVVEGRVEAIAVDGDTVVVGGTFSQIQEPLSDAKIDQPNLFAYSKSSGDIIREFDPVLNGAVRALEVPGDGSDVFVGGGFGNLNGQGNLRGLLKINNNGNRANEFTRSRLTGTVNTLVRIGNTLYAGDKFGTIRNLPIEHLAAPNATNGEVITSLDLDFGGVLSTNRTNGTQGVTDIT